jgi:hypothetical protein
MYLTWGVNLLSGTALCNKGLRGGFDRHALHMYDRKNRPVLKAVKHDGIYIVNRIAPDLRNSVFPSTATSRYQLCIDGLHTWENKLKSLTRSQHCRRLSISQEELNLVESVPELRCETELMSR